MEVARAVQRFTPCYFFDSALTGHAQSRVSLIAAFPEERFRGHDAREFAVFYSDFLASNSRLDRICAGVLDYGGAFDFSVFSQWVEFDHELECWRGPALEWIGLPAVTPGTYQARGCRAEMNEEAFCAAVEAAKEWIRSGDIYQVNLSRRFRAEFQGDAFSMYEELRKVSPAPYAAWMDLGDEGLLLSSSPELFLEMHDRRIQTQPIKGTRPRGATGERDRALRSELAASPKEKAELVMITDLERNDLGQVCRFGSVEVADLLRVEPFAQVFHLVSTVTGFLRPEVSHADALIACSPGGSVTGAPKRRAREIISALEPVPRGMYTGSLGWFGPGDEARFNIAIRTAHILSGVLQFHAGAGIVADSDPHAEFVETGHKAAGILAAAGAF